MSKKEETTVNIADIARHIEAMAFTADQAISIKEIEQTLKLNITEDITKDQIKEAIAFLTERYASDDFAIAFVEISKGFRFMSKSEYHRTISSHLNIKAKKRLSKAAMETLSIIAYKQPISKSQIEEIRGVNSDYGVQKLLEKDLIEIIGRGDSIGRPLLYGPSQQFMDHFGLKSVKDLPKLKEVIPQHNQIGDNVTEEEVKVEGSEAEVVTAENKGAEAIKGEIIEANINPEAEEAIEAEMEGMIKAETEEAVEAETEEALEAETEETVEAEVEEALESQEEEVVEAETEEAVETKTEEPIEVEAETEEVLETEVEEVKAETEEPIEAETEEAIEWETAEAIEWETEDEIELTAEVEADLAVKNQEDNERTTEETKTVEAETKQEESDSKENLEKSFSEEEKSIGKTSKTIE